MPQGDFGMEGPGLLVPGRRIGLCTGSISHALDDHKVLRAYQRGEMSLRLLEGAGKLVMSQGFNPVGAKGD